MKLDELIEYAEIRDNHFKDMPIKIAEEYLNSIALATLKITKNGYAIVGKEYGDMIAKTMEDELVHIDESYKDYIGNTELDAVLKELENE